MNDEDREKIRAKIRARFYGPLEKPKERKPRREPKPKKPKVKIVIVTPDVFDVIPAREIAANETERPKTRGDCVNSERPCPWISCRFHLISGGSTRLPKDELSILHRLENMPETCALDVADRGGIDNAEIGRILDVSRERVRQLLEYGLEAIRVKHARSKDRTGEGIFDED